MSETEAFVQRQTIAPPRLQTRVATLHRRVQSSSETLERRVEKPESGREGVLQTTVSDTQPQNETQQLLHLLRQAEDRRRNLGGGDIQPNIELTYTVFQKRHPFCFSYNIVSRRRILVIFGSLAAKEICNRTLLTGLKEIAGALRKVEIQLRHYKIADDA